jgi:hypothetical protein
VQYVRELVRIFTQPSELCIVFPDAKECEYALEEYGGQVPFGITPLSKPQVERMDNVNKVRFVRRLLV